MEAVEAGDELTEGEPSREEVWKRQRLIRREKRLLELASREVEKEEEGLGGKECSGFIRSHDARVLAQ